MAAFEQEKFELQKQNTKNMEDLLTETNERLTTMEADYAKEADSTACIVKDLENRLEDCFFLINELHFTKSFYHIRLLRCEI